MLRRALAAGWLAALALLALTMLPGLPARLAAAMPWAPDGGYPQRVGFVRGAPDLPRRPGALTTVLEDNNGGNVVYEVLSSTGRAWTVSSYVTPALSPTARSWSRPPTPWTTPLPCGSTTCGRGPPRRRPGRPAGARPAWPRPAQQAEVVAWSVDQPTMLVSLRRGLRSQPVVVDARHWPSPRCRQVACPLGSCPTVGWPRSRGAGPTGRPRSPSPSRSRAPRSPPYRCRPALGAVVEACAGGCGDPRRRASCWCGRGRRGHRPRWFDPGHRSRGTSGGPALDPVCAIGWRGETPVFSTKQGYGHQVRLEALTGDRLDSLIAVHHRAQSSCLEIADAALEAGPVRQLWKSPRVWTWYWRPVASCSHHRGRRLGAVQAASDDGRP
ncbi:MAG: hypothetical protein R2734_15760 [Nocardioides sp.]